MSDPAGQTDIESVLHSIRRLVSEKTLPRLVLTSDQRVSEEGPLVLTEPANEAAPDQRSLEDRIAELEAVVAAQSARETGSAMEHGSGQGRARQDVTAIDENALRDMVSDLVREELQGAMGERITRNMRRLVRREIMRAIAAGDLD
ncbi:hypothetical protein [Palleronia sp. LCG004]|uniref:hypothetical protein n=1 Tax=Palleronia sp. LCG004 TaxID=3079304 RepID=UPI002942D76D|nr:hypothetical protein [Palleronia sp. LCG004]WOI55155.1 hypothetical protein RVY76_08790 [Palleronia sp. LCG004]